MISKEKLLKVLNGFIYHASKAENEDPVMLGSMLWAFTDLIKEIESGRFDADETETQAELTQARAEIEKGRH